MGNVELVSRYWYREGLRTTFCFDYVFRKKKKYIMYLEKYIMHILNCCTELFRWDRQCTTSWRTVVKGLLHSNNEKTPSPVFSFSFYGFWGELEPFWLPNNNYQPLHRHWLWELFFVPLIPVFCGRRGQRELLRNCFQQGGWLEGSLSSAELHRISKWLIV